jgi:hypothetical protein
MSLLQFRRLSPRDRLHRLLRLLLFQSRLLALGMMDSMRSHLNLQMECMQMMAGDKETRFSIL